MKKLMIAAAAAMAGTATFGGLCDPEAAGPDSCSVYNIKFTFKTLSAKTACAKGALWLVSDFAPGAAGIWGAKWYRNNVADKAAAADNTANGGTAAGQVSAEDYLIVGQAGTTACENDTNPNVGQILNADQRLVFWMDNATRKFEGIAWQCKSACFEGLLEDCDPNNNGRLNYVIWEKKNSLAISYPVFQVKYGADDGAKFTGDVYTSYFSLDAQREMFIGRYGKKAQKVAAFWDLWRLLHGQNIWAAGFGTYDVKNLRTKSVSGNAVGMIMPVDEGKADECGNKGRIFCALGFMCVEWMDWCCDGCYTGVDLVPASGTWSLKYNASATKKANSDKATLASFVPAYMFYKHSAWKDARAADPWLHTDNYYWYGETSQALFFKEGGADAERTRDAILDDIAAGARVVIDIVFDGVYTPKKTVDGEEQPAKYTYGTTEDDEGNVVPGEIPLENGVLPAGLFPESVTTPKENGENDD